MWAQLSGAEFWETWGGSPARVLAIFAVENF